MKLSDELKKSDRYIGTDTEKFNEYYTYLVAEYSLEEERKQITFQHTPTMKTYILLAILLISLSLENSYSQTVKFNLPAQKGKTLYLLACKGVNRDTIFSGNLDEKGFLVFTPSKDKPLSSGVVSLFIQPDIHYDFIYSDKENPTLHSEGEYIYAQNTHFHDSPENDFIESKYMEQMERMEKIMFLHQGMQLYKPGEKLYSLFQEEKSRLEQQQAAFETMLQQETGNLYSARLMTLQNLMNNYVGRLQVTSDTVEYARIREHVLQELDTETLYSSGMWFSVINGMLELYYKESPFYGQFGEDITRLLERTKSQEVFLTLANDAATICNQYSWNIDEVALSKYLNQSGRVINPQGKLKQMLTIYELQPGMPAPALAGASLNNEGNGTLLMFYESGCNSCDNEINQLVGNYPVLKDKNIEVISIAADNDKTIYENNSTRFPWKNKLCDFKGFEGENFKNYGVMGTPTIYMIDKNGIIQGKYASLADVEAIR